MKVEVALEAGNKAAIQRSASRHPRNTPDGGEFHAMSHNRNMIIITILQASLHHEGTNIDADDDNERLRCGLSCHTCPFLSTTLCLTLPSFLVYFPSFYLP